jgi:hypothetical protein
MPVVNTNAINKAAPDELPNKYGSANGLRNSP